MKNNLLNLSEPHEFGCRITSYTLGHHHLSIEVQRLSDQKMLFFLHFYRVIYFAGLMAWRGCELYLASDEEYLKLLYQVIPLHIAAERGLTEPFEHDKLYIFSSLGTQIHIIAKYFGQTDNPWVND